MKRVLYVEANEDGTVGGSHKILYDLVIRLSPAHHPVVLFYEENIWARRLRERGVEVHTWDDIRASERKGLKEGGKVSTAVALAQCVATRRSFLKDQKIDLVHLNNSPFIGFDDWLPACSLVGIPCVAYIMGDNRAEPNPIRRFAIQRYDAYFPLSLICKQAFLDNGIDEDRMVLAYPGVDIAEADARTFRPADEVRREFHVAPGQLLAVMVGNIRRWKGQNVVIEALGGLDADDRARLKVLMVGQGGPEHAVYEKELADAIEAHGLGDMVRFTGRREDVPDLLEAADLAIHASVTPEPFGLVVQEAMLHGCATIAANEGGPVEMMTPDSGLMFDTDHPEELTAHLSRLIRDREARETLAARARVQARTFDVQHHVDLIEERYAAVLS